MDATKMAQERGAVESVIRSYFKDVDEINYIDHGHDNLVVAVNQTTVFRFPKNSNGDSHFLFEVALLQHCQGKITAATVPELTQVNGNPLYSVAQYIPGEHLTAAQLQQLTQTEQAEIGKTIARVMVQLGQAISFADMDRLRKEARLDVVDEPWPMHFKRLFESRLPNERQRPIVDEQYGTWKSYYGSEAQNKVIHDDMTLLNMLFVGPKLQGILGFSSMTAGSIEQSFRGLYQLGPIAFEAALGEYHALTGYAADVSHIKCWAIMQNLAIYTEYLAQEKTTHPIFLQARASLREWIPNFSV